MEPSSPMHQGFIRNYIEFSDVVDNCDTRGIIIAIEEDFVNERTLLIRSCSVCGEDVSSYCAYDLMDAYPRCRDCIAAEDAAYNRGDYDEQFPMHQELVLPPMYGMKLSPETQELCELLGLI